MTAPVPNAAESGSQTPNPTEQTQPANEDIVDNGAPPPAKADAGSDSGPASADAVESEAAPAAINAMISDDVAPATRPASNGSSRLETGRNLVRIENPFRSGLLAAAGVMFAIGLASILMALGTVLTYVGAALFLALGMEPIISWLEKRKWPRPLAILTTVFTVFGVFAALIWAMIPSIVEQAGLVSARYGVIAEQLAGSNVIEWLDETFPDLDAQAAVSGALSWLRQNVTVITGGVLQWGASVVNGFFGAIIIGILTLYFVSSMNSIQVAFYRLLPRSRRKKAAEITNEITGSVGKYVIGQTSLAMVNGVLTFAFMTIAGGALPAVFALVAFMGSLIPLVGTLTSSIIIVLAQLALGDPGNPLWWIAAIYYVVYMQIEAYVISPRIMSSAVSVPGPIVVIAALTGGTLMGIFGALIAIPVAASILILVNRLVIPHQDAR